MITQVMKFGILKFLSGKDVLEQQSYLSHKYYNDLVQLELDKRKQYQTIRSIYCPELEGIESQVSTLTGEIESLLNSNKSEGGRKELLREKNALRKELRERAKVLRKEFANSLAPAQEAFRSRVGKGAPRTIEKRKAQVLQEMSSEGWPFAWKELAVLEANNISRYKALRAASGITHGTYASTEEAVKKAFESAGGSPRFRGWLDGQGRRKVGLQMRDMGLSSLSLESPASTQFRILSRVKGRPGSKGNRSRMEHAECSLHLGKNLPTIRFVAVLHRPIPASAVVRWVYLVHDGKDWTLQVTIQDVWPLVQREPGVGVLKVLFKWERVGTPDGDTLEVAEFNGANYLLHPRIFSGIEHSRAIRSASDKIFSQMCVLLRDWVADHDGSVPSWMLEEDEKGRSPLTGITKWRDHSRLQRIAKRWTEGTNFSDLWEEWKAERLSASPKEDLFCHHNRWFNWCEEKGVPKELWMPYFLGLWLQKDLHLKTYESGTMRRCLLRRKNDYLNMAAHLSSKYESVYFLPLPPKKGLTSIPDNELEGRHKFMASCSELQEAISLAFGAERVIKGTGEAAAE